MKHSYWRWYLVGSLGVFALLLLLGNLRSWNNVTVSEPKQVVQVQVGQAMVRAEVAATGKQKDRGLSGRSSLAADAGMWFPFPNNTATAFWMKDMLMPIDIIWVGNGQVVSVNEQVLPPASGTALADLPLYAPAGLADAVLEVNAGWAKAHEVTAGSSVRVLPGPYTM